MGERAGIGADWLDLRGRLRDRTAGGEKTGFGFSGGNRARAGGGAAQAASISVAEASTRRLDVGPGPLAALVDAVVCQGVQTRQAGSGRQEHQQQEESPRLNRSNAHHQS